MVPATGFTYKDGLMLWVGGTGEIPSAEWAQYCELVRSIAMQHAKAGRLLKTLIVTDSSAPNSVHRSAWNAAAGAAQARSCVIASNPLMRNIATVFSWMDRTVSFFAPGDWRNALDYLEVPHQRMSSLLLDLASIDATLAEPCRCVALLKQHANAA